MKDAADTVGAILLSVTLSGGALEGQNTGLIGLAAVRNFLVEAMAHEPSSHGLRPVTLLVWHYLLS